MFTPESGSLLQLRNADAARPVRIAPIPPAHSLMQLIRREGLDRIDGDFLEIGDFPSGESSGLTKLLVSLQIRARVIQRNGSKVVFPEGTRLAFAMVDRNLDPASVKDEFQIVWNHLAPGGWVALVGYAGEATAVTIALNAMLTEYSAAVDRVERIKDQQILLIRKRSKPGNA
jgi:hypothetical protein